MFAVGSIEGKTLGAVVDLLEAYARVLLAIAEVEEATGKRFDEFLRGLFTPEKLRDLYNKLPGEVYGGVYGVSAEIDLHILNIPKPAYPTGQREKEGFRRAQGGS
jgi:hypothetical protein